MRILMIEDDADTAEIVCSEFREHGYDIVHESDGREGLRRAMGEAWDVIIADRTLPGMEGLSIVKTLRAAGNATPILVLSALGNVVDRVDGLQAGGDDYLPKPYAFVELLARVEGALAQGRARYGYPRRASRSRTSAGCRQPARAAGGAGHRPDGARSGYLNT